MGKQNYCQRYREERRAYFRRYYQEHREEMRAYFRRYQQEHREEKRAYKRRRKRNPRYKKIGDLLKDKLEQLNENQSWLAKQLGVSRETSSNYIRGIYFPRKKGIKERLCRVLEFGDSELEDLVKGLIS